MNNNNSETKWNETKQKNTNAKGKTIVFRKLIYSVAKQIDFLFVSNIAPIPVRFPHVHTAH